MGNKGNTIGLRTILPGIQFLNDSCEYALLIWRFRLLWVKHMEDWRVEFICQDDLWQVGAGPFVVVCVLSDDY